MKLNQLLFALTFAGLATLGATTIEHSGDILSNETWHAADEHLLTGQTFVKDGVTLTIEPGTTVLANEDDGNGLAPALVIERGGKIMAAGTPTKPITFTTSLTPEEMLDPRGNWGGIILLGKAPISTTGGTNFVEGLEGVPYGGTDPDDNSGVLQYVRIWHGGRSIGQDNEINGITCAGVGRGTTIDHCEIAYNLDDGIEFFGGTVDISYIDVLFVGDDCFDVDEGYQGRGQFLFALEGADAGNRAYEMDNQTNGDMNSQPRSHPQFFNVTLIGSGSPDAVADNDQVVRLREGVSGDFGNTIIQDGKVYGVNITDQATLDLIGDSLNWSSNNIIYNCYGGQFAADYGITSLDVDPQLTSMDGRESGGMIDPRPARGGAAYQNVDMVPDDDFFVQTDYKGAFSDVVWMDGYSLLNDEGRLAVGDEKQGRAILPSQLTLEGNYPNPFNPTTKIQFSNEMAEPLTVTIYAITGQQVNQYKLGVLNPGTHAITWDGTNATGQAMSSGIYLMELSSPSSRLVGKMTLLK
ncbi:MAG: FlgD immunoglobulin-like domain containing protein [Fidelibacterota bacterium]